jgi:pSer/pThr/pTyr-binding forkhead associated (FHA) protein
MFAVEVTTPEGVARVALNGTQVNIGRTGDNDIVLAFLPISRHHAEMRLFRGSWWIADFGSTNGIYIENERVKMRELRDGDIIVFAPGISMQLLDLSRPGAGSYPVQPQQPVNPGGWVEPQQPANPGGWVEPPTRPIADPGPLADWQPTPQADPTPDGFGEAAPATWQMTCTCPSCGQETLVHLPLCSHCRESLGRPCLMCGRLLFPSEAVCPQCQTPNPHAPSPIR